MHKVASCATFFANLKENSTYITNIFCTKKYGDIGFQKQAAYLSFALEKVACKNVDENNPWWQKLAADLSQLLCSTGS